jgi:YHS domain-containing protein
MKKTLLTVATLALLAGAPALVRAGDMDNMPGMNMSGMNDQTNIPAAGTNAPVKPYPFKYCLTSGEKLGEMGKPITTNYLGQEIKFCCPDCVKDFKKDPDKYVKKLQAAEDKAAKK